MNERKLQVILTAQRLFTDKGFTATSIQDILDEAKISKGTFYNYFTSKNECLIAIMENAYEVSTIRRRELLIGQPKDDKNILAEQILVRMQVNREQNLLPIYEAVFYSGDAELRQFVASHHMKELEWLTSRLTDVYGEEAERYALDCAIMILGVIQQLLHFWASQNQEAPDIKKLVHFTIRRVDAMIYDMIEHEDTLFGADILAVVHTASVPSEKLKAELIDALQKFRKAAAKDGQQAGLEYIDYLLDELQAEKPKRFIIEAVARSFREAFTGSCQAIRVNEIVSMLWEYVDHVMGE